METKKSSRKFRNSTAAGVIAAVLVLAPVAAANATPYWSPVTTNCGSKYVQMKFTTTGGWVKVGYASSPSGDYGNGAFWEFYSAGTYTRNPGWHSVTWQKWSSVGELSHWGYSCVSYL